MGLTTHQIDALRKITSPSVANAIETFNVRAREEGNLSSDIRAVFPEMGPMVGYAATAVPREGPDRGHRASQCWVVGLSQLPRRGWWWCTPDDLRPARSGAR